VGSDLTRREPDGASLDAAYPVTLRGGDAASGLADMLHQFLSQNLAELPGKVRQARRLDGDLLFRSAEDEEICVKIAFQRERIELEDHQGETGGLPSITSDFVSTAHLTTGEESPFSLLVRRKIRVSFGVGQVWFLLRVLRFMRIPGDARAEKARRLRLAAVLLAFVALSVLLVWYLVASP